jgi:hypothetical protein
MLQAVEKKPIGMIIPLYSYPTDEQEGIGLMWDAVADAGKDIAITVVMGSAVADDEHSAGIEKLHQSNIRVLGYVSTALSTSEESPPQPRDIDEVKSDIEYYATNFDVDGIFLDEGLAFDELENGEELFDYYQELDEYAKSFSQIKDVMLNVSFVIKEDIERSTINDFVVFENRLSNWESFLPSQYDGLDFNRLHIIVHEIYDVETMQDIFSQSAQEKIENVYFTDNEFSHLPSYWFEEIETIKAYNNSLKAGYVPILHYLLF